MELDGSMPVYFEHHILLWKTPSLEIGMHPMKGAFKRAVAGMPIFMTEAKGAGQIAFSRDGVGHVFHLHLAPGQTIEVREHQFLAATANVDYSFRRLRGVGNMLFGGTGIFIDTFAGGQGGGTLWLHGYGNVFEKVLGPGEAFDVEPGGWVYKDPTGEHGDQDGRPADGHPGRLGQPDLQPLHRPRPDRHPEHVPPHADGGLGRATTPPRIERPPGFPAAVLFGEGLSAKGCQRGVVRLSTPTSDLGLYGLGLDGGHVDRDLDLVADENAAALESAVPREPHALRLIFVEAEKPARRPPCMFATTPPISASSVTGRVSPRIVRSPSIL
jgi:hypothetical protein